MLRISHHLRDDLSSQNFKFSDSVIYFSFRFTKIIGIIRNTQKCLFTPLYATTEFPLSCLFPFKWWPSAFFSPPSGMIWIFRTKALLEHHADHERHHLGSLRLLGRRSPHGMGRLWLWADENLLHTRLQQRGQVDFSHRQRCAEEVPVCLECL